MSKAAQPPPADLYDAGYYAHVQGFGTWAKSHGRALPPRLEKAVRLADIAPGVRLIDLGSGRGEVAIQAALLGARSVGVDYSAAAREISGAALENYAEGVQERCVFLKADVAATGFPDATFDRATMLDLVEHLTPLQLEAALAEAWRVLRPGGRLVVHTEPNRNYVRLALPVYRSRPVHWLAGPVLQKLSGSEVPFSQYRDQMHVNEQSPASLRQALARAGFQARVWTSTFYATSELRDWRAVARKVLFTGWPVTAAWPLSDLFGLSIWAVAER